MRDGSIFGPPKQKVTIVEMLEGLALDMEPINRLDLREKIQQAGIEARLRKTVKQITEVGIVIADGEGEEELIHADQVVLALGVKPNDSLFPNWKERWPNCT